jgi:hypothetical protein
MNNKRNLFVSGLTTKFDMAFNVCKSSDEVFKYISQPELFVAIHPVIYKIQELEHGSWKIFEKLRFAGIPFSFCYPATMQCDSVSREISMKAKVMSVVSIDLTFQIQDQQETTRIHELITINSIFPIHPLIKQVLISKHRIMFEKLNQY